MHKLTNVSVLSNIVRLGISEPHQAFTVLRKWQRVQHLSQRMVREGSASHLRWQFDGRLPDDMRGRLFMSFHYGLWFLVLGALTQGRPGQRVFALISRADDGYTERMSAIARAAGIDLVLVPGGISMLRGVRRAQAEGAILFVLIDVPWGLTHEADLRFPFMGGQIEAKSALFTLAERVGLQPHLLVADFDEATQCTQIIDHGCQDQARCFELLEQCVAAKPWLWERLFDIHKYVHLPASQRYLPFRLGGDFYLAEMQALRVFRVNRVMYDQVHRMKRLIAHGDRDGSEQLVRELHEKTSLGITTVF
jgi:hypothetical protein